MADVTEAKILSQAPSVTYAYYFEHIKPKPQPQLTQKKGWVCKVCGYVYEGEELPRIMSAPCASMVPRILSRWIRNWGGRLKAYVETPQNTFRPVFPAPHPSRLPPCQLPGEGRGAATPVGGSEMVLAFLYKVDV